MKTRRLGATGATLLLVPFAAIAWLVAACGGGGGAGTTPQVAAAPARGNSNLIVEAEVRAAGVSNALEAVQRLRPAMLRQRGSQGFSDTQANAGIVVYVDGIQAGGVAALANVQALSVKEIRFISAADATTRFGTGHPMGAILVVTRR